MLIGPFKQILTMSALPLGGPLKDSQLPIIEDGGVVIDNGRFVEVGEFNSLQKGYSHVVEIEENAVALPGLIDCHTHICFTGSRASEYALRLEGASYQEIASRGGGILNTVKKTRQANEQELIDQIFHHSNQLIKTGVTTCEVKSGYGLSVEDEIKMLTAIQKANEQVAIDLIPTCLAAHTTPQEFNCSKEYLKYLAEKLLPTIKKNNLSNRIDIFVEKGAFWIEEAREYLLYAKQLGFNLTLHADQFTPGGAKLAAEIGAVSADHLEVSSEEAFAALQKGGVSPVVLPGASLGLGIPFAKARQALNCGAAVAIASDWNPGSAPMGELLTQASLLSAYEKLTMAETLAGITYRAAHALRDTECGEISPGKRADLAIFPSDDYREILYHQGSLKPSIVIAKGKKLTPKMAYAN